MWCVLQVCGVYIDGIVDKKLFEGFRSKEVVLFLRGGVVYEIIIDFDLKLLRVFNFLLLLIMIYLFVYVNGYFVVNFV